MRMSNLVDAAVIATVAAALGAVQSAAAKTQAAKKPTYEEAWSLCTARLNQNHILGNEAGQRYAAGAACMLHYGYRI